MAKKKKVEVEEPQVETVVETVVKKEIKNNSPEANWVMKEN